MTKIDLLQHVKALVLLITGNSTQFMRWRVEGEAHTGSQIQVILWNSRWRSEAKALHDCGEEDEELHPGQTLSKTNPSTCEIKKKKKEQKSVQVKLTARKLITDEK